MNSYSTIKTIEKDIKYNKNFISKGVQKKTGPLTHFKTRWKPACQDQYCKICSSKFSTIDVILHIILI